MKHFIEFRKELAKETLSGPKTNQLQNSQTSRINRGNEWDQSNKDIRLLSKCNFMKICCRYKSKTLNWGLECNMSMPISSEFPPRQVVFLWFSLSYSHRDTTLYNRNSTVKQIGRATEGGSTVRRQAGKEAESRGGSVNDGERVRWRWWWKEREAVVVYITSPGWSLACVRGLSHQSLHLCKITSWLQYC